MKTITLTAPAKVNLLLEILDKRKDSYHNIFTLFEKIDLADEITISKAPKGISLACDRFITRRSSDNIAYKAAGLVLSRFNVKGGVRISIKKRIPIAAGLGGGSSDAASVLLGMNKLFNLNIDEAGLIDMAKRLGADVPFFVIDAPFAIGRARGDLLERADLKVKLWHLIIYPGFRVATKDIYEALDAARKHLTLNMRGAKILPHLEDFDDFENVLHNDLERIVADRKRTIRNIIERLASSLHRKAIVSGSGPSVFCLYRTREEAVRARRAISRGLTDREGRRWQVFVAATMS